MASFVSRQAFNSLRSVRTVPLRCHASRYIHLSPVVQKKKSNVVIEDLFGEGEGVGEELIKPEASATATKPIASSSSRDTALSNGTATTSPKRRLSPEKRLERFNEVKNFVSPRLGRKPSEKLPLVRKSAWVQLVGLASNEEQLTEVVEMFPGWKESGHAFDNKLSELFVQRCEELSCPPLALKVFGNFSKYNLPLTLPGARQLLHSLHVEHPIDTVIATSALYSVYSLPPVSQDLASCAMLISACFKHNSKDSLKVAHALLPHLQEMLSKTEPISVSSNPTEKALDKPSVWIKWTLKKIDKTLFAKTGERAEWLKAWRDRSGHTLAPHAF